MPTVSDVRPVRHHARQVRSEARCVRRVASTTSPRERSPRDRVGSFGSSPPITLAGAPEAATHAPIVFAARVVRGQPLLAGDVQFSGDPSPLP